MFNKQINILDTPSLLLDLNKLENNLSEMNQVAKNNHIQWRPHIKTHKSVHIAKLQLEKGATGITVAKVDEADVMVKAGIENILIAYPISSKQKLERVRALAKKALVILAIDSIEQGELVNSAFEDSKIEVWIKVNSGLNRCGVESDEVLPLAKALQKLKNLQLKGIFTHAGHSYAASSSEQIKKIAIDEAQTVLQGAQACEEAGIKIEHRSIGSTPTYKHGATVEGITEIRPGNAAFFDMCQVGLGVAEKSQCALTVLASVVSKKEDRIIFDTGSKALSLDQGAHGTKSVTGFGYVLDHPEIIITRLSEEHGVANLSTETKLKLTDKVQIIPNHSCVVANLFDEYIVHRNGMIVDTWPVDARGQMK